MNADSCVIRKGLRLFLARPGWTVVQLGEEGRGILNIEQQQPQPPCVGTPVLLTVIWALA
jgi:hypothetical protein